MPHTSTQSKTSSQPSGPTAAGAPARPPGALHGVAAAEVPMGPLTMTRAALPGGHHLTYYREGDAV